MEVDDAEFRRSIERGIGQTFPVDRWKDWKGVPTVSVALPLSQDAREGNFYAFLPMDTVSPFNGCLDAPFHPDANRRGLDLDNPLNGFLLDSVADLCLAVARTIAASDTSSPALSAAAVDALAWSSDPQRMLDACERAGLEVGDIQLPAIRRREGEPRWASLSEIYDWTDANHRTLSGQWLARACGVSMLRRGLGPRRVGTLRAFIENTEYPLDPAGSIFAGWAPLLAADLASRRRKATRQDWEDFYLDLMSVPLALPHMRGMAIFRLEDGSLGAANSPETLDQRELFISADPENATRRRKRLAGTALFPPRSVAQRMHFADPLLSWARGRHRGICQRWPRHGVQPAQGDRRHGTAARPSDRAGKTPTPPSAGRSPRGRRTRPSNLRRRCRSPTSPCRRTAASCGRQAQRGSVPVGGDTSGDTLAELCKEIGSSTRTKKNLCDSLLVAWEEWPQRERGTAAEWVQFLRLLGVRDGLTPVYYKAVSQHVNNWRLLQRGGAPALAIEEQLGETWRTALANAKSNFAYMSGDYSTGDTLFALPLQMEHPGMSDRPKRAYARLAVRAIPELATRHLATILSRTTGMGDTVAWPSPLLAFLAEGGVATRHVRGPSVVAASPRLLVRHPHRDAAPLPAAARAYDSRRD